MERMTQGQIERLLAGHNTPDPRLSDLQQSLQAIRETYSVPVATDVRAQHLQAMMAAFGQTPIPSPAATHARRARLFRRASVAAAASVLVGGSALAATGSLPAPAQDAVARVAHDIGIDIPHSPSHPTPRAPSLDGPQFAAAKRAWLECVKEKGKDACGPKPQAQDFVHTTPKASHEPQSTEPSEHGVGNPHHSPVAPKATENPGHGGSNPGNGDDHPNPSVSPPLNSHGSNAGGESENHTPPPLPTPHS